MTRAAEMTQNPVTWVKRSALAISQNGGREEPILPGSRMPQLADLMSSSPRLVKRVWRPHFTDGETETLACD